MLPRIPSSILEKDAKSKVRFRFRGLTLAENVTALPWFLL